MNEMVMQKVFVTKEIADKFLENNPLNRPIKSKVEKIKNDLIHGRFEFTHQPIAIATDGSLVDGQHRLVAISETGIPAWMWVCINAPRSSKIDRGTTRSDRESLYMAGLVEKGSIAWKSETFPLVNFIITRSIGNQSFITEQHRLNIYKKFKYLIDPIISLSTLKGNGKCRTAVVFYSMACALNYGISIETITKWYKVLITGDFYSDDHSELVAGRGILFLRNYLSSGIAQTHNHAKATVDETIGKIMISLYHFNNKKEVKQIKGKIVFPELQISLDDLYRG